MNEPVNLALCRRLRAGETVYNATAAIPHPTVVEQLARAGYRSITLDVQHGAYDYASINAAIAVGAAAGAAVTVRIGFEAYGDAARYLDAGAAGVIAPMINSMADADRLVGATRYPPVGQRSWGPGRATALSGMAGADYLHGANGANLVMAMIETSTAVENVDAIIGRDGIDGIFVGPLDLTVSLTGGRSLDPDNEATRNAMARVAEACTRHGKVAGAYAASPALASAYVEKGYRFLAVTLDTALLASGAAAVLQSMPRA